MRIFTGKYENCCFFNKYLIFSSLNQWGIAEDKPKLTLDQIIEKEKLNKLKKLQKEEEKKQKIEEEKLKTEEEEMMKLVIEMSMKDFEEEQSKKEK